MVEKHYEILWNATSKKQLKEIYQYIQKESSIKAKKVVNKIIESIEALEINPERFGLDKFKLNNDGTYRYIEVFRFRIAFRIYGDTIRILRIRSTDQEPLNY